MRSRLCVPRIFRGWGTQGESMISYFISDMNRGRKNWSTIRWVQYFLARTRGWKYFPKTFVSC